MLSVKFNLLCMLLIRVSFTLFVICGVMVKMSRKNGKPGKNPTLKNNFKKIVKCTI